MISYDSTPWANKVDEDGNPIIYEDITAKFVLRDEELKEALIGAIYRMELPEDFNVSKEDFARVKEVVFDIKGLNLAEVMYKRIYGEDDFDERMFKYNEGHEIDWAWLRGRGDE